MPQLLLVGVLALLLLPRQVAATDPAQNTLTAAEKAAGWQLLFDGRTLDAWRGYRRDGLPDAGWEIKDGTLRTIPKVTSGDLITRQKFHDFEFAWEWRVAPGGNNGVKYFVTEDRPKSPGHEYQMIDDPGYPGRLGPNQLTADFYDVLPAAADKPLRPAGEWNASRIVVRGTRVEHWLNGRNVLTYELGSEAVKAGLEKSKFKGHPGFGEKIAGHIMLTYHQDECSYRNLKIRETKETRQQRYSAARAGDIVRLTDSRTNVTVSVLTTTHNAYEIVANGHNILRTAFATLDELRDKPGHNGIPLLAPFANRLDEPAFHANGRRYTFDLELGNIRGGAIPIHGFVTGSTDWELVEVKADGKAAWVTSRLDFYRNPQYMKQFPFAHTITMTYRLADGALEVRTRLDNASREPMPVAIGFHPYFELTESSRDDWTLSVPAKTHWLLAPNKIPTGQTQPIEKLLANPRNVALKGLTLDDGFSDLERDAQGRGVVTLKGERQQVDVMLGPKFTVVLVYLPQVPAAGASTRGSVAIEPMAGVTNSMNLAHKGLYKELQSIPPNGSWEESFWIRPRGF